MEMLGKGLKGLGLAIALMTLPWVAPDVALAAGNEALSLPSGETAAPIAQMANDLSTADEEASPGDETAEVPGEGEESNEPSGDDEPQLPSDDEGDGPSDDEPQTPSDDEGEHPSDGEDAESPSDEGDAESPSDGEANEPSADEVKDPTDEEKPKAPIHTGWLWDKGVWRYFDPATGEAVHGVRWIDGASYCFNDAGVMLSGGWVQLGPDWYYAEKSGALRTGWLKDRGKWYWLQPNRLGLMAANEAVYANGTPYAFDGSGAMLTDGWVLVKSGWYWAEETGVLKTGWLEDDGKWYWLWPQLGGRMATGWVWVGGTWYYFDPSGAMATGWRQVGGTWYYLNDSGAMATGWHKEADTWYYLNPSGAMVTGWAWVNDVWYYFWPSGTMATGWVSDNGVSYYLDESGAMATGWLYDDDTWYYLQYSGAPATGLQPIEGAWYFFLPDSGAMATGWVELGDGICGYFGSDGAQLFGVQTIDEIVYDFGESGCISVNPYENPVRSAALVAASESVPSMGHGRCAMWVNYVYVEAGYPHPDGNACDLFYKYCNISDLSLIQPGMIIAVPSHTETALGRRYGHVGIYLGNGMVRHDVGYVETIPLETWLARYQTTHWAKCGWAIDSNA